MNKQKLKAKGEILFGIELGINTIAITWLISLCIALLIQVMGVEHNSNLYIIIMSVVQILIGFISTILAIKIALKSSYLINNDINKAMYSSIITTTLLLIIDYSAGCLLPIIPFYNIVGVIIMSGVYAVSQIIFKNIYE